MKNCELAEFGSWRARHADRAACERNLGEFGRKVRQIGTAGAGHLGLEVLCHVAVLDVAGLGHEAVDHAVEGDIVVGALLRQFLDARDVLRRNIGHELDDDRAVLELDGRCDQSAGQRRCPRRTRGQATPANARWKSFMMSSVADE